MSKFIAWSHSRLKTFKDCPKQFYHMNVPKKGHPDRIEFVQTQAMKDGNEIDDALTKYISHGTPLPGKFVGYQAMADVVRTSPGTKLTQAKYALDETFSPCGYMDWDKAWVRVIYDVAVINGGYGFLGDWKNGQVWLDEDQLRLFATVGFHHFPEVQTFDTAYIWLKHGVTSDRTYHRRDLEDLWGTFIPDVERLQIANANAQWPATPSKRACKWCAVNKAGKCSEAAVEFGG